MAKNAQKSLQWVTCLDDGTRYGYAKSGNVEAMEAHIKYLNIATQDPNTKILLAGYGRTIYCEHRGKIYAMIDV